jgi:superfamily I DNA/RNA helicase
VVPAQRVAAAVPPPRPIPDEPEVRTGSTHPAGVGLLDRLDPEQRAAAAHPAGPLLIVAGPGTGKTRTLTHRIAHLVAERGVRPEECLAITFTRRAAEEMRERLQALMPERAGRATVTTFHGLGAAILRECHDRAGLSANFRIADEAHRLAAATAVTGTETTARRRLAELDRLRRGVRRATNRDADRNTDRATGRDSDRVAHRDADRDADHTATRNADRDADRNTDRAAGRDAEQDAVRAPSRAAPPGERSDPPGDGLETAHPADGAADLEDAVLAEFADQYERELRERDLADFSDLLRLPVRLLACDPALAARYRDRWRWICVDEYQDVDETQYALLRLLSDPAGSVTAIGDPDQAIYAFRGADVGFFLRFRTDYPSATTVQLTRNYRSTPVIVAGAVQAIAPSTLVPGRTLYAAGAPAAPGAAHATAAAPAHQTADTSRAGTPDVAGARTTDTADAGTTDAAGAGTADEAGAGTADTAGAGTSGTAGAAGAAGDAVAGSRRGAAAGVRVGGGAAEGVRIGLHEAADEHAEADFVTRTIDRLLGGASFHSLDSGRATGHGTAGLSFSDIAILYRTDAQARPVMESLTRFGIPFQKRSHDRLASRPGVQEIAYELRHHGTGGLHTRIKSAMAALLDRVADTGDDGAERAVELRAAAELLGPLAGRCDDDLDRFLQELALGAEVDTYDPRADRIALLTLHAAKGLEFPVVFLIGCESGLLPLRLPGAGARVDEAEERRLFFVGMTRARSRLYLSYARGRTRHATARETGPSPFLRAIDAGLLERVEGSAAAGRRRSRDRQLRLL